MGKYINIFSKKYLIILIKKLFDYVYRKNSAIFTFFFVLVKTESIATFPTIEFNSILT